MFFLPCLFSLFPTICAAVNVASDEYDGGEGADSSSLCVQCYHVIYKYYNPEREIDCSLCGSKHSCHGGPLSLRNVPKPQSTSLLVQEAGNFDECLTDASVAFNACHMCV